MFIFIAAVAFVMMDTATAVADVSGRYIDTAYTLGASRWQIISKVLVPLAMPRVFNSLRLLFGLAFGYIMLAELVTEGGRCRRLGKIILMAQRRGHGETILADLDGHSRGCAGNRPNAVHDSEEFVPVSVRQRRRSAQCLARIDARLEDMKHLIFSPQAA